MATAGSKSPGRVLRRIAGAAVAAVLLRGSFSASKCKTEARMAAARMKLLRNRREAQVRQMRRDIAALLRDRQEDTARIRVEHVIREQNIMAANEIIDLFCELIVTRLPIIAKQKECPADLKEGICSLIFAAPRCSELPELGRIRDLFEKKYGKDFVSAAVDLRPDACVNNLLIEKLSVKKPSGQTKLKILKEIAKEHQIDWDMTETEQELLKPSEELIQGPNTFVEATNFPVKTTLSAAHAVQINPSNYSHSSKRQSMSNSSRSSRKEDIVAFDESNPQGRRASRTGSSIESNRVEDKEDTEQVELSARRMRKRNSRATRKVHSEIKFDDSEGLNSETEDESDTEIQSIEKPAPRSEPYPGSHHSEDEEKENHELPDLPKANLSSRVHPNMPLDYETLTARFEALKSGKLPYSIYLQTANRCNATGGIVRPEFWQGIVTTDTELRNALSTSSDAFLLSKHMTYSIAAASQGSVILPSPPANPNSSCDILRSSTNTVVQRYGNGTSNRAPSDVYTAQWPLSATGDGDVDVQPASSSSSLAAAVLILCSFLVS
uniref:IST1-like protein n=1 Tax=Oryza meridionalis TaxID=40149 RepID=A0A0E0DWU6_9ORYZ